MAEQIYRYLHDENGAVVGYEYHGELIRCQDCRHYDSDNFQCETDKPHSGTWFPQSYCDRAERKSERLIDANKLMEAIESLDWYHLNINGEMVHGANSDDHQAWYKSNDIYEAISKAPTVQTLEWTLCKEKANNETE